MTYPLAPLGIRMRAAIGVFNPASAPSSWPWVDITADVRNLDAIDDEIGATDDDTEPATRLSFNLDNVASRTLGAGAGVAGRYTTDNPESDLWPYFDVGTPIEYSIDVGDGGGWDVQVVGFIETVANTWPSHTQYKCVAQVTCTGLLQRDVLNGAQLSPMTRTILSYRRLAFYPLDDDSGATQASSALPFQPPMIVDNEHALLGFGAQALVPGVAAGVNVSAGQGMAVKFSKLSGAAGVRVACLFFCSQAPAGQVEILDIRNGPGASGVRYAVEIGPNNLRFRAYNASATDISGAGFIGFTQHLTRPVYLELDLTQSGTNVNWTLRETGWVIAADGSAQPISGSGSGSYAGTLGTMAQLTISPFAQLDNCWMSALNVCDVPFPSIGGFAAVLGWAGNTATGRVSGMAGEARLPASVTSTTLGAILGPQLIDTLRANMIDVMRTDHGVLTDHTGAIAFRALTEISNTAPVITLSRTVRGQLGELEPIRDNSAKGNRVTVHRPGGGSVTVEDRADIVKSGLFQKNPDSDLNVATDNALMPQAGWYLARGTASGYRYSELTIKMRVGGEYTPTLPGLIAALRLGDRIAASSLPPQAGKNAPQWIVRGRKQTVLNRGMMQWDVTYRLVPTDVYDVFQFDIDRFDTSGTEIILAVTTTGVTFMTATAGALAAIGSGLAINLDAGGEQVLLTAVAAEVITDAFTRTVSNGWGSIPATTHMPALAWTPSGTAANYAATGSAGTITIPSAGQAQAIHLTGLTLINPDMTIFCTVPSLATGDDLYFQVSYRYVNASGDAYTVRVSLDTGAAATLRVFAPDGTNTAMWQQTIAGITHTAGATYGIRIAPIAETHRVRVWQSSTASEPSNWTAEFQETSRITGGYEVVQSGRGSANTNAGIVFSWDNLTFNNVQAFTVTRSQGAGIVKAQPVGSQVRLWRGKGLGI